MNRMKGLTIIQLMVVLLIAGIVTKIAVAFLIDKRCENSASTQLCADRKGARAK
jgi:Tfp pilus assembly protein PilE